MHSNKDLDEGMFEEMDKLADVNKKTQQDRDRMYGYFCDFLKKNRMIKDLENPGGIRGKNLENPSVIEVDLQNFQENLSQS